MYLFYFLVTINSTFVLPLHAIILYMIPFDSILIYVIKNICPHLFIVISFVNYLSGNNIVFMEGHIGQITISDWLFQLSKSLNMLKWGLAICLKFIIALVGPHLPYFIIILIWPKNDRHNTWSRTSMKQSVLIAVYIDKPYFML